MFYDAAQQIGVRFAYRDGIVVSGFGAIQLWHNLGDGTFAEVADKQGLHSSDWNVSAAAGDFNRDGLVDLYILTYANWKPDLKQLCKNDQGLRDICGPTLCGQSGLER